jgi:single-strand DNA-binding protein
MARDVNKVMVMGNLGADPEMRFTADGTPITNFRIAVNRMVGGTSGERRQETDWFTIVAWRKLAETCNQYLTKGKRVYIEGRLQIRSWQDKEGQTRYQTEIIANDVIFLDRATSPLPGGAQEDSADLGEMEPEELPF